MEGQGQVRKKALDLARTGLQTVYLWITLVTVIKAADKEILGKIESFIKVAVTEFGSNTCLSMIIN